MLTRCEIHLCDWTHSGTAHEGRAAFLDHRKHEHPLAERVAHGLAAERARRRAKTPPVRLPEREPTAREAPTPALPAGPTPAVQNEPAGSRSGNHTADIVRLRAEAARLEKRARLYRKYADSLEAA